MVELVGKGTVLELRRWWGKLVVGLLVGFCVRMAGGRKRGRHVHMPAPSEDVCVVGRVGEAWRRSSVHAVRDQEPRHPEPGVRD